MQVLVDSSVWIDYFTGKDSPETDYLDTLIGQAALVVPDVVLMEVLHGLPDEVHRRKAQEALLKFWLVETGGFEVALQSAVSYHTLKARGIPVRTAECLLATFCILNGFALLHSSPGFDAFEKHFGLQVATSSLPLL